MRLFASFDTLAGSLVMLEAREPSVYLIDPG